jgi:hypothetical protein
MSPRETGKLCGKMKSRQTGFEHRINILGYRAREREFLELVDIAKPKIIYRRKKNHFFAYDGFMMYSQECKDSDFGAKILNSMEFSN